MVFCVNIITLFKANALYFFKSYQTPVWLYIDHIKFKVKCIQ